MKISQVSLQVLAAFGRLSVVTKFLFGLGFVIITVAIPSYCAYVTSYEGSGNEGWGGYILPKMFSILLSNFIVLILLYIALLVLLRKYKSRLSDIGYYSIIDHSKFVIVSMANLVLLLFWRQISAIQSQHYYNMLSNGDELACTYLPDTLLAWFSQIIFNTY